MPGRLSTVYDFSSLRIHPDGTRVQQSSAKNHHPRYAASAVQDSRGNWFAHDAAGSGAVGRYQKVRKSTDEGEDEVGEEDEKDEEDEPKDKGKAKAKQGTGHRQLKPRPAKRQKFIHNFDFLAPAAASPSSSSSSGQQPLPSSDLLKSIHYFASTYYDRRGQLLNVTQDYRRMRKRNKQKRLEEKKKAEEEGDVDSLRPVRRGGRVKGEGKRKHPKDMYKILDGSALVAIGMLMQEYVARMLEVRIPDGWEEMMRQAYADTGEDSLEEEGEPGGEEEEEEEVEPGGDEEEDEGIPEDDEESAADTGINGLLEVDDAGNGGGRRLEEDSEEDSSSSEEEDD